ncbi:MAG TPA: hypothetical protein VGF33_03430 [Caulobacteraceae bacterium]
MSAALPPWAGDRTSPVPVLRDLAFGTVAACVAVIVAASTLIVSPSFFLTDDYITYFAPGFHEIARLIVHGQAPLLTDRLWNGGDLLREYQYAVFNPVSLLLYLVIGGIGDLSAGAAIYSLTHIAILAAGAYALCRSLGCLPRHAFLAGAVAPLSDWVFFWGATNWIPALVSLAWLSWAWALLVLAWRKRAFAPAAAIAVALTLLSGWPFADFALLISASVAFRVLFVGGLSGRLRHAAWPVMALLGGSLLAMPALLPLEFYVAFAHRPAVEGGWAADLTGLLEFGMPLVQVRWGSFSVAEYETVRQPIVYAAWFAPLALAGANWRSLAADRRVWIVLGSALAFAALSMISHVGLLRWMFRLMPYYQLALIVTAAMALTTADEENLVWKFDPLALVIAAEVWLALSQARSLALIYLGIAYAFGTLAWVSTRFGGRRDARWTAMALAASVGVFALTVWNLAKDGYPQYPRAWKPPVAAPGPISAEMAGPERLPIVHRLANADPGHGFWSTYRIENTALYWPGASISGYSPVLSPTYANLQCAIRLEDRCDDVIDFATAPLAPTGRNLLDLTGVGEVVVEKSADAARFAAQSGPGWTRITGAAGETRFVRSSREAQVTWASSGATGLTRKAALTRLEVDARNDVPSTGKLIIARAWYPAWHAMLDGRPVPARPLDGMLISVDLPPKSEGRLVLSFWPAGLTLGIILAMLGAAMVAAASLFPGRLETIAGWSEGQLTRRRTARIGAA